MWASVHIKTPGNFLTVPNHPARAVSELQSGTLKLRYCTVLVSHEMALWSPGNTSSPSSASADGAMTVGVHISDQGRAKPNLNLVPRYDLAHQQGMCTANKFSHQEPCQMSTTPARSVHTRTQPRHWDIIVKSGPNIDSKSEHDDLREITLLVGRKIATGTLRFKKSQSGNKVPHVISKRYAALFPPSSLLPSSKRKRKECQR